MTPVMQKGLISGIILLYGCGKSHEETYQSYGTRLTAVEQQLTIITQQLNHQERQEEMFLRNLEVLHAAAQPYTEQHKQQTLEQEIKTTKGNFLSWSKKTLDNISDLLIDNP